jgi:hypothetical protein
MKKNTIIAIVIFFFIGCSNKTDIGDIISNPRKYENKVVHIEGFVTTTFSIPFLRYFEISDETGTIYVITNKPLPAKGKKIKITGRVKYYTFLSESLLVIEENEFEN